MRCSLEPARKSSSQRPNSARSAAAVAGSRAIAGTPESTRAVSVSGRCQRRKRASGTVSHHMVVPSSIRISWCGRAAQNSASRPAETTVGTPAKR